MARLLQAGNLIFMALRDRHDKFKYRITEKARKTGDWARSGRDFPLGRGIHTGHR